METIDLDKPILFMEFFVSSVEFHGKDKAKSIQPKTLHHVGKSLAKNIKYFDPKTRKVKTSFEKYFGFKDGKPVIKRGYEDNLKVTSATEGVCLVAKEYFSLDKSEWFRTADHIVRDLHSNLPYGFNIKSIDDKGNVVSDFPRGQNPLIVNNINVYLCHSQEYQPIGMDWAFPNIYLVLYVKNYGFHKQILVLSEKEFVDIDSSKLCQSENISIRDYRKSKFKFFF